MKKIFIALAVILVIIAATVFFYRYQILQYSAETLIRNLLPSYIKIGSMVFEPDGKEVKLKDFAILNPPGFSSGELMQIKEISCAYRMRGKSLLDGIEIMEPSLKGAVLNIERLKDGHVNAMEMKATIDGASQKAAQSAPAPRGRHSRKSGGGRLPDIIKLPDTFNIRGGRLIFTDRMQPGGAYIITLEGIDSDMSVKMNEYYTGIENAASTGQAFLNGNKNEVVQWTSSFYPMEPKLTMSNRFEVSGLDVKVFEPYYDRYSPFVFKKGRFGGLLIFDFNNGHIGSSNEIHLSELELYVKPGYENAQFWDTTVRDLARYFTSPHGDIVFDFKIKGDMASPNFYLGPISKQALASMAIDKISEAIQKASGKDTPGGKKTDLQKAGEYIELVKGFMKK